MKPMKKSGKRGSRYFDDNIKLYGPNFLETEPEPNLRKRIPILCKDIGYGNIDLEKYGKYFTPYLIDILYDEVYLEYVRRYYHYIAMYDLACKYPNETQIDVILKEDKDRCAAYEILYTGIRDIKRTGTIGYIDTIAYNLKKYRFSI